MDNSKDRLNDVFFYGLYMDEEILKSKGVIPRNKRIAVANGYKLKIGNMATLLKDENSSAHGMLYSLTHAEIYQLYAGSGLDTYVSEAILVESEGKELAVLCCNLLEEPKEDESNEEYFCKLVTCMEKYNLQIPVKVQV